MSGDSVPLTAFAGFAEEHATERLYAALARLVAQQPSLAALLLTAPPTQRKPVLWFAALHDRLLALAESRAARPPLADYFGSLDGERAPDDGLAAALQAFLDAEHSALRETIASRATQTNEVGRCAVLWPALSAIAQAHGQRPLALFDFGCSAGLNLPVDAMGVAFLPADPAASLIQAAPGDDDAPQLRCRLLGAGTPPLSPWRLASRMGTDLTPVSLDDARALRWLRACLWPGERTRHARFERALALAKRTRPPVQQATDGLAALEAWLPTLPAGCVPVLFNSWVLCYFTPDELRRHTTRVQALIADPARGRGLVWLSAEDDTCTRATTGIDPLPPRPPAAGTPTWWALTRHSADGAPQSSLLACSHPHGEWLQWLA